MPVIAADPLQKQIDARRKEIHSDQYSISIGELSNLYRDGELDLHPEFQRYFRWSPEQKSRFVESILLGIPVPSLFVSQRGDGKWDVIDGLQRLSTLFELMGILRDEKGELREPLELTETKYLPALKGRRWKGNGESKLLGQAQQLLIKRAKLDIKIILRESDDTAKFELFQRINTGGSPLTDQEIRNAMLVAGNAEFYRWLEDLSQYQAFEDCATLSERAYEERFDLELVLRFVVLRAMPEEDLRGIGDLGEFLTEQMLRLSSRWSRIQKAETAAFQHTFDVLSDEMGADAFRRFDAARQKFTGGFLISAFEAVALGMAFHVDKRPPQWNGIRKRIQSLWRNPEFTQSMGAGIRAAQRIPEVIRIGRSEFTP